MFISSERMEHASPRISSISVVVKLVGEILPPGPRSSGWSAMHNRAGVALAINAAVDVPQSFQRYRKLQRNQELPLQQRMSSR